MTAANDAVRERQRRWERFLAPNAAPGFMFMVRKAEPQIPPRPALWPQLKKQRLEWIWNDYQVHQARAEWLHDDLIPALSMITGTEIFAEALGCRVHRPDDNMPFALPLIRTTAEVSRVKVPDLASSTMAYLFEMADELRRRAGPEATFRMVDMQSPMDIAALVMEKSAFFMAMIEEPDAVRELALKARQLLTAFLDEWFKRYGRGFVAHFPDYYMPRGVTLSEDEIGAVSEDVFNDLFLPELNYLSDRYGALGMHCCANARHQWPHWLKIRGLKVLNICQPREVMLDAYPFFAGHVAQMHGNIADGPPESWLAQYPPQARVILETGWIETQAEAESLAARLNALRGEH